MSIAGVYGMKHRRGGWMLLFLNRRQFTRVHSDYPRTSAFGNVINSEFLFIVKDPDVSYVLQLTQQLGSSFAADCCSFRDVSLTSSVKFHALIILNSISVGHCPCIPLLMDFFSRAKNLRVRFRSLPTLCFDRIFSSLVQSAYNVISSVK